METQVCINLFTWITEKGGVIWVKAKDVKRKDVVRISEIIIENQERYSKC